MSTLYDILGVGHQATAEQIKHGYQERLNSLKEQKPSVNDINQVRVIKEAYLILSSAERRKAYDEKLNRRVIIRHETIERRPLPWATTFFVVAALLVGGLYYHHAQAKKERLGQLAMEVAKAKAEADKAAQLAAQEEAALERARLLKVQQEEAANRVLTALARSEGQRTHAELQNFEREKARLAEHQAQMAKLEQEREERAAKARSQEEIYRMQRALSIPISRH